MNIIQELRELADKYEKEQKAATLGRVSTAGGAGQTVWFRDLSDDEVFVFGDEVSIRIGTLEGEATGNFVMLDEDQVINLIATLERWVNTRSFK